MKFGIQVVVALTLVGAVLRTPTLASVNMGAKSGSVLPASTPQAGGGPACLPSGTGCGGGG